MYVLNAYFCRELRFVVILRPKLRFFTQKYRSWLKFYSEFLRKKLAVEVFALYGKNIKQQIIYDYGDFDACFLRDRATMMTRRIFSMVKLAKSAPCWAERVSSLQLLLASHFPNCSPSPQVQRWGDSHWGLNSLNLSKPNIYIQNDHTNKSSRVKLDSTQEVWGRFLLPQWSSWPRGEEGRGLPTRWK